VAAKVTLSPTSQQFKVSAVESNGLTGLGLCAGGTTFASGEIDKWGMEIQHNSAVSSVTNILPYSQ
jgi:hypothetical protein